LSKKSQHSWFLLEGNPYKNAQQLAVAVIRHSSDITQDSNCLASFLRQVFNRTRNLPKKRIDQIIETIRFDCPSGVARRLVEKLSLINAQPITDQSCKRRRTRDAEKIRSFILDPLHIGLIQLIGERCLSPEQFDTVLKCVVASQIPLSKAACNEIIECMNK
jgi:hypothetical protein